MQRRVHFKCMKRQVTHGKSENLKCFEHLKRGRNDHVYFGFWLRCRLNIFLSLDSHLYLDASNYQVDSKHFKIRKMKQKQRHVYSQSVFSVFLQFLTACREIDTHHILLSLSEHGKVVAHGQLWGFMALPLFVPSLFILKSRAGWRTYSKDNIFWISFVKGKALKHFRHVKHLPFSSLQ